MSERLARRLVRAWALNAEAQARALAAMDKSWGAETHRVGSGRHVLSGRGMYVNRVLGAGVFEPVSAASIDLAVSRSHRIGVQPSFEVTSATSSNTIEQLGRAGFAHDETADVVALVRSVSDLIDAPTDVVVRPVGGEADLSTWQATSAIGWGHVDRDALAASNAFAAAAHVTDQRGMVIAYDAGTRRAIGCASVTIRDGIATLGGMSTHPEHRRRGVQRALIAHRLRFAIESDCDVAASTTPVGSASERNLRRFDFAPVFTIETWTTDDREPCRD